MRLKKIISSILIGVLACMSLAGCASSKKNESPKTEQTLKPTQIETTGDDTSKVLVVYYSATGSTRKVAENIAKETGGDLFELVPKEVYTSDDLNWSNEDSRVTREHNNPDARDVELEYNTVDNWSDYDTIFIGYPIWWGIAAWPVNSFVQLNDFTGKKVIPFATSASSGLGDSGSLLEKQAGTGNWQDGKRFSSGADENEVAAWISELGL